ncbi:MAG TPA: arginase family protein [Terrimesophilobacter sp.]|uniref:arginase family protein n=1 Tax=Terrimesophilobacter sp. TaxID=2906435 RepID=UPI002F956628
MPSTFLVVPQWQGSGSTRALQLQDGAGAIRGDLPSSGTIVIDTPLGAGESLGSGIRRLSSLQIVRDRVTEALRGITDTVITIGGDCGVELAPVSHAHQKHPGDLALVWFDAHPDLNTAESSPSGAFHGMILRTLLGDGFASLVPENPIGRDKVVIAGARSLDDAEAGWIAEHGISMIAPGDVDPTALVDAIAATGASAVYLHIDLDVLDPAEFGSLSHPEPFGVSATTLGDSIRAIKARFTLAGAAITEFAPSSPEAAADDLPTILRIIGALTAP